MAIHLLCLADDLKDDANLYVGTLTDANFVNDLSGVRDNDTVIIYTHGQYFKCRHGEFKANNKIKWGNAYVSAATAAANTFAANKAKLNRQRRSITIIVHACFTAGTVERSPKQNKNLLTFAGQYCSSLSNGGVRLPSLRVIGYQGATKVGSAGYKANQAEIDSQTPSNKRRRMSRSYDPTSGSKWQVTYVIGNNGVEIELEGESVIWR
jgi:hypothetical protein